MNRSALTALALATAALALALHWPVAAQESAPPTPGRFQISTIPGAVYMADTATGDLYVRDYQTKRWRKAGNPLSDSE